MQPGRPAGSSHAHFSLEGVLHERRLFARDAKEPDPDARLRPTAAVIYFLRLRVNRKLLMW